MADIKDKMSETVNTSNISVGVPLRSSDKDASCDVAEGCQVQDRTLLVNRSSINSNLSFPSREPSFLEELQEHLKNKTFMKQKHMPKKKVSVDFTLCSSPGSSNTTLDTTAPSAAPKLKKLNLFPRPQKKDIFINFTLGNESSTSLDNEVPHDTTMNLSRIDESKKFGKRPQSRRVSVKFDCDGSVSDDSKISLTQDPLLDKTQSPRAGKVASLRSNSGVKRKKRNESDRVNFTLSDTQDSIPSLEASISDLEAISETSEVLNTYISSDLRKEAETNAESDIAPEITAHAPICAQRDDVEGADCNNGESHDHAVEGVDSNSDRRPGSHAKDTMGGSCPPVQETANNDSLVSGLPQDTTVNLSRTGEFKNCFKRPKSRRVSVKFDCDDSLSDDSKVSLPQEELLDKTQSLRAGNAVSLKPIHSDREEISKLAGTSKVTSLGSPVSSESRQEEETNAESDIAPEITVNSPICAQRDDVESADCNNGESHDNAVEGVDLITDRSDTGLMVRGCAERGSEYPPPNPIPVKGEHRTMQNTPGPHSIETVKGSCPPVPETSDNGSSLTLDYEVPHDTTVNLSRIGEANKCFKRLQSRRVSVKFDCDDLLSDDSKVSLTQDEFLDKSQSPRAGNAVSLKPIHSDSEEISKLAETSKVTSPETSDNGSSLTLDYEVPHETNAELDIAPDITADAADGSELEENPVIQHVPHALLSETMTIRSPLTSNNNDQVISTDEASLPRQVTEGDSSEVGSRIYQSGATRSSPRINVYTEDVPKIADEVHNRLDDATYILAVDQSVDESVLIEKQKPNLIVKRQSVRQKNKNIDFTLNETLHSVSTEDSTLKSRNYENPLKKRSSRRNKVSVSLSMDSSTSHDASNSRLLVEDGVAPSPSPSVEAGAPYRNEITPTVEAYPQNGTMPGTCLHSTMMQNVPDTSLSDTLTVKSPPANNSYDLAISIDEASLPRQVTEGEPSFGGVESPKVGTEIDQSGATRPRINVFTDDGPKVADEVHNRSDGAKYISAMDQSGLSVVTASSILPQLKNTQVSADESVLIEKQKPNLIVRRQSVRQKNKNIDFTFSETLHPVSTEDSTLKSRNYENPLKKRSSRRNKVSVPLSMDSSTLHDASNSRLLVEDGVAPSPNPSVEAGAPYRNEITPTVEEHPQNGSCLPIENLPNDDKMLTKDGISVVETEDFDHSGVTASNNHMQQNNTQEMPLNDTLCHSLMDSQELSETPFAESIATKKSTLESEYHNHLKSREFEKNEVSVCRSTQPSSLDNEKACATLMVVSSVARSSELTFPGTAVAEGDMHEIPTIHNSPGSLVDIQRSGLPKSESFDQDAKRKPINALMDVTKNCASDIHSRRSSAHSVVREGGKPSFEKNSTNDEHLHLAVSDGDLIQKSTSLNSIDSASDPIFCKKSVISADSVGCADSLAQTKCALPSKPSQPSCVHDVAEVDKKNTSCVVSSAADDVNSSCPINHEALPPPSSSLLVQPSSSKATHNDPATNDCSPPAVEVTMKSRPSSDDDPKAQAIGEKNLVDIPLPSSIVKDTVNRTAIKKLSKSKRKSVSFKPPHQNVYHSPNYHYNELNQNSSGREGGEKDYNEFSKIQMTSDLSEIQTSVRATRSKKHCSSTPLPKPKQRRVASASFKSVQDRDDVRREGNTNNGDLFAKPVPVSALVTEFLVPPPPLFAKNPDSKLSPGRISPVTPVDPAGLSPRDGKEKHATGRNSSSSDKTSIDLSIENSLNISVIPKDRVAPKWGNVFHSTPIHRPRPSKTRSRKSSPEVPNVAEDHPVNKSRKLRSRSRQESQISMDVASPISSQNKEDSKVSESVDSARGRDGSVDHLPESNQSSSDDSSPHRVSIKDNTVLSSRNVSHSRARDFASSKSSRSSHLTRGSSYQSYDSHRKPVSRRLIVDVDSADEEKENDNGNQETSIRGDVASPAQSESLGGNDGCADTSVSSLPPSYSGASPASSVSSYDSNIAPYISQRSSLKSQLDSLKKMSSSSSCQGSEATFPRHQTRNVDEPKKPRSKFSINRRSKTKPEDGVIFPKAPKRPRRAIQKPPEGSDDLNEWSRQPRKLFKPGKWASKKFYNWLEQKLKPEHGLKATVMAEKFVIDIYHAHIMASNHHLEEARATLRERTKELGICSTELEYSYFILKFLPLDFKKQFLPLGGAFGSALAPRALPYDAL